MRAEHASGGGFSFDHWLRTGRLIRVDARWGAREVKFNPNHDPKDGRFTFADGGGVAGMSRAPKEPRQVGREDPRILADERRQAAVRRAADPRDPANHTTYVVRRGDTLSRIAATRVGVTPADLEWLNGLDGDSIREGQVLKVPTQAFLDKGKHAFDTVNALRFYMGSHGGALPPDAAHPPSIEEQISGKRTFRPVEKNGYWFGMDSVDRTRTVEGDLYFADDPKRSGTSQGQAGGPDRRADDDGGHFIAARFGGPRESFNHSHRTPTSIGAAIACLKTSGRKTSGAANPCMSTLPHTIRERRDVPIRSASSGLRVGRDKAASLATNEKDHAVAADNLDLLGPALSLIGRETMAIVGGELTGVFLFVEAGEGWVGPSIYKDEGQEVRYYDPSHALTEALFDLWLLADEGKEWTELHYTIQGGKFHATFEYEDRHRSDDGSMDHRDRVLQERYGDKPVVYPPIPRHSMEYHPDP